MTDRTVRCNTCRSGDWAAEKPRCKECIGFSKWEKRIEYSIQEPIKVKE